MVSLVSLLLGIEYMIFPVVGTMSIIIYLLIVQLGKETQRVDALFETSADAMVEVDRSGIILKVNANAVRMFGYSLEEFCGMCVDDLVPQSFRKGHAQKRNDFFQSPEPRYIGNRELALYACDKRGTSFPVEISLSFLKTGERETVLAGIRDISKRLQIEEKARRDHLTGLYNRSIGEKTLGEELEKSRRYGHHLSVIMCDIDHFKQVNDNYGHNVGDDVLILFSKILLETVREVDIACRWGGEEFLVICPNTDKESAFFLAERLREFIAGADFDPVPSLTSSFGVATYKKNENHMGLVKRADDALYRAKQEGRDRVVKL